MEQHQDPGPSINDLLPIEILCAIFCAAGECGYDMETNLRITFVCSHWRDVALANPWMWTCYSFQDCTCYLPTELHVSLIERSGSCPLEFYIDHRTLGDEFEPIIANIGRISLLQCIYVHHFRELDLPGLPAPMLENLSISGSREEMVEGIPLIMDAPRLKTLDLVHDSLPWKHKFYHNLVDLQISTSEYPEDLDSSDENDILNIARVSPDLKHLKLEVYRRPQSIRRDYVPTFHLLPAPTPPLHMHALQTLELKMRDEYAVHLLTGISLPQSLHTIYLIVNRYSEAHLNRLLDFHYIPSQLLSSLHTLRVSSVLRLPPLHYEVSWCIEIWGRSPNCTAWCENFFLVIQYTPHTAIVPEHRSLSRLLPALSMPALKSIDLVDNDAGSVAASAHTLAAFISRAPALTVLGIGGSGMFDSLGKLCDALRHVTSSDEDTFPRLECIQLGFLCKKTAGRPIYEKKMDELDACAESVARSFERLLPCTRKWRVEEVAIKNDGYNVFIRTGELDGPGSRWMRRIVIT